MEEMQAATVLSDDDDDREQEQLAWAGDEDEMEVDPESYGESIRKRGLAQAKDVAFVDADNLRCVVEMTFPFHTQKLSMLGIAERTAATCNLRSMAGIQNCYVAKRREGEPFSVQTDGVSFEAAWQFAETVDVKKITSNDISAVLKTYGVEAARNTIINECKGVFGAYGISINPRHLGLIADYMTNLVKVESIENV